MAVEHPERIRLEKFKKHSKNKDTALYFLIAQVVLNKQRKHLPKVILAGKDFIKHLHRSFL